jgi:hypothetical protein
MHAMRRTLFVVHVADAPVLASAASRDVAAKERRRVETWVATALRKGSCARHLARVEGRVLEALREGGELRTQDLSAAIPELATELAIGSGKWAATVTLASRLLSLMAMEGRIVRTRPAGSWRSSQYRWAATEAWFGRVPEAIEPAVARAEVVRRYLATHGPATLVDLRWWTGWTAKQATTAAHDAGAVPVGLEGGEGLLLRDDPGPPGEQRPHATFLPGLDPTPMGWKERGFYLGELAPRLFDRNGNVGPTVWVDGHIVGGWSQRADGEVVHRLLVDVGRDATRRIAAEAAALTAWMDGVATVARFRTPLDQELSRRASERR